MNSPAPPQPRTGAPPHAPQRRGLSIAYWLLIANTFVVLVPAFALLFLRLWDSHLVRIAEERLIAEASMLADAWRVELRVDRGTSAADADDAAQPAIRPLLVDGYSIHPNPPAPSRTIEQPPTDALRAAARIAPLVRGVERRHSSEVELLDPNGCVLAASDLPLGTCLDRLPEVAPALTGEYMALTRAPASLTRVSLEDIKNYRSVLVFVALPVWAKGQLAGVVRMSARSSGLFEAAWDHRGTVAVALSACVLFMLALTFFLSRVISRPVQQLTAAAEAVARGESLATDTIGARAPAELRSLRNAVSRMTEQLTDRAEYIAGFATTVSHELKTPITSIRGAIELLRDDWETMSDDQRERFLENVDADAERMERLVARLLQLARIQSAPETAETIEVCDFFTRLCRRYGDAVRVTFDAAPERLTINPDHLETATHNLIDNAVRHGKGRQVDVVIGTGSDGRVSVSVRDYGTGISSGNRARVFDRFFTTEREHGGTGLGLAIVQAVAQTRGGDVRFETSPSGSTFVLTV